MHREEAIRTLRRETNKSREEIEPYLPDSYFISYPEIHQIIQLLQNSKSEEENKKDSEVKKEQEIPIVGEKKDFQVLIDEYHNPKIKTKIQTLSETFKQFRPIRGDGNCFYRAIATAIVEEMIITPAFMEEICTKMSEVMENKLINAEKNSEIVKEFRDSWKTIQDVANKYCSPHTDVNVNVATSEKTSSASVSEAESSLESGKKGENEGRDDNKGNQQEGADSMEIDKGIENEQQPLLITIHEINNNDDNKHKNDSNSNNNNELQSQKKEEEEKKEKEEQKHDSQNREQQITEKKDVKEGILKDVEISNRVVRMLRTLTSHSLKFNETYQYYISDNQTIGTLCASAEQMGEEAEQLHIIALMNFIDLGCEIYQLDGADTTPMYSIPNSKNTIHFHLLYRPGHYDLLYKSSLPSSSISTVEFHDEIL